MKTRRFAALLLATLAVPSAARAEWVKATSEHFIVYTNDSEKNVKEFSTKLERFDKAMRALWSVPAAPPQAAKLTIFLTQSRAALQEMTGNPLIAGYYQGRSSGPVAFMAQETGTGGAYELPAQTVLQHEYSHHFMFSSWPTTAYPKWFSEGFAEFSGTAMHRPDGSVLFGAPTGSRGFNVLKGMTLPASTLLRMNTGKLDDDQTLTLYARGWLLTHYLMVDPERRKQLAGYISSLNAGKPVDETLNTFGEPRALDGKLNAYAKSPRFQSLVIPADKLSIGTISVRALTPAEAATIPAMIRSTSGVDKSSAPRVAAMARRAAAPFPNDAFAQNVLAEAEYDAASALGDAGDFTAAMQAVDRALAADPRSVHAMIYKGMILQAKAEKAKATDAATWGEVRKWYVAANRADTEYPHPLVLYYRSYEAQKVAAPKPAQDALLYAYALAPYDRELRATAAKIFLTQGKAAEAKAALIPVAFGPHTGKTGEKLQAILATLDKDGAPAALAALEKLEEEAKAKAKEGKSGE